MPTAAREDATDAKAWWSRGLPRFSLAAAVGYGVAVAAYELLTPWWAGDHVGLSTATLAFFYGPGAVVFVATVSGLYGLAPWVERKVKPRDVTTYRRRAWAVAMAVTAVLPGIVYGAQVMAGWLRHR